MSPVNLSLALDVLFVLSTATIIFLLMMLHRNRWVYRHRMRVHELCFGLGAMQWYAAGKPTADTFYPSYDTMLWKFWVWDADKFLLRPLNLPAPDAPARPLLVRELGLD